MSTSGLQNIAKHFRAKGEWFFNTNGITTLIMSAVFIFFICFVDYLVPSQQLIPPYIKHIMVMCLVFAVLSMSLNFVSGYIGQTSLGHAAFFGMGAYVTGILTKDMGWNYWPAFLLAGIVSALVGIPLAAPALRVKGGFLVVITYGFGEVFRYIAINTDATGGPAGMPGIPTPVFFKDFTEMGPTGKEAYIIFGFILIAFLAYFMHKMEKSRTGYAFAAIREDEIAATAMGINVNYYKMLAFVLAAFFGGLAGSMYVGYSRFVSPEMLASDQSIYILTMVIVGGARSIKGSILGAALLVIMPEAFRVLKDLIGISFDPWLVFYGFILIVMMRVRPQGFWGKTSLFTK